MRRRRISLYFIPFLLYFAGMNRSMKFELICERLSKMDRCLCHTIAFSSLCSEYGAELRSMDNMFYDRFGMSGEEVMEQYRNGCMNFLE